jgi:hypothetical protein
MTGWMSENGIGLRYGKQDDQNRIDLLSTDFSMKDYFNFH